MSDLKLRLKAMLGQLATTIVEQAVEESFSRVEIEVRERAERVAAAQAQARAKTARANRTQKPFDPYRVLGIPSNSDFETVKRVYRALSLASHPDQARDDEDRKARTVRQARLNRAMEEIEKARG